MNAHAHKRRIRRRAVELRVLLLRKGIKQKDVAAACGVPEPYVAMWLNGTLRTGHERIADFFARLGAPHDLISAA